jgi:ribonuclease R
LSARCKRAATFYYVIPDDPRLPHDVYTKPARNAQVGDKVVVKLANGPRATSIPKAKSSKCSAKPTRPGVDILAIIRKYQLPTQFSEPQYREVARLPETHPGD